MKALHLVKTAVGATWALRQMAELVKSGVETHVALPDGPLVPRYKEAGITTHVMQTDFPIRQPYRFPELCRKFRKLVIEVAPDVIHSHFVGTTLTMRLALGKTHPTPRVFQVPGPLHLEHSLFRGVELSIAGANDFWIGSCQWTCQRYRVSGIADNRIFLSYYGIDTDRFLAGQTPGKLRTELGVSSAVPLVGMVAYMYAPKRYLGQQRGLKGHEDLIDALAICRRTYPEIKGIFIGGAWNRATAYESQVRAYGKQRLGDAAVFLGTRSDVAALYPDLNVVVHPSHSENVGGAGESLLSAVPTIATNTGGFPDVVIPGQTGWLVPVADPPRLADAILEALANQEHAKELALKGQAHVKALMDIRKNAQDVLTSYQNILAKYHHRMDTW